MYCVDDLIGMNAFACHQHVIGLQNICNCSRIQGYHHVYALVMMRQIAYLVHRCIYVSHPYRICLGQPKVNVQRVGWGLKNVTKLMKINQPQL
jgi:hypothetical protein